MQGVVECGTLAYWGLVVAPVPLIAGLVWKAGNDLADRSVPLFAVSSGLPLQLSSRASAPHARTRLGVCRRCMSWWLFCLVCAPVSAGVVCLPRAGRCACAFPCWVSNEAAHAMALCARHEEKERLGFDFVEGDLMWTRRCGGFAATLCLNACQNAQVRAPRVVSSAQPCDGTGCAVRGTCGKGRGVE